VCAKSAVCARSPVTAYCGAYWLSGSGAERHRVLGFVVALTYGGVRNCVRI
jgi:hypothetical protein